MNWGDVVYYDETSPSGLRWKVTITKPMPRGGFSVVRRIGDQAGGLSTYRDGSRRSIWIVEFTKQGKRIYETCHRVVWGLFNTTKKDVALIDHIDGNSLNNLISNLRDSSFELNMRNKKMYKSNSSGKTGVYFTGDLWMSQWVDESGTRRSKSFSISKYGEDAFSLAVKWREQKIRELNEQGAGYTDRHGKEPNENQNHKSK